MSAIVGSKAGNWGLQAYDHAFSSPGFSYIAVAYLKPPPQNIYDTRSRWVVYLMPSRQELDAWYQATVAENRYHYVAAFDKTAPEWNEGRPVSVTVEPGAGNPYVGAQLAPETYRPAALHAVARRAHPGDTRTWLYVSIADGNSSTRAFDDYQTAINALEPYFRAAAAGMMGDVLYWAVLRLGSSGPEILRDAVPSLEVGADAYVGDIFGDIGHAVSSAVSDVAKVIQHPPAWLAVVMPLFTPGTQKWWAGKIGGKTGEQLYDAGTNAVVAHALGPTGPKLLSAFNSVMDDAAKGHLNAQEMIAKAPQVAHLAMAAKQSPQSLQQAIVDTGSHVKGSWANGRGEYGQSAAVGAAPSTQEQLHHLDQLVALHETYWADYAQHYPSPQMRAFLQQRWDPFLARWFARRHFLDTPQGIEIYRSQLANFPPGGPPPPTDLLAAWVESKAIQLSELREIAADNGIPTPDLGTTRHGFIPSEDLKVSGRSQLPYNAARRRTRP